MTGTGAVNLGGVVLYVYFAEQGGLLRVRLSADEWDLLGLCEGQRVRVGLPGRPAEDLLITAASRVPPVVWVNFAAGVGQVVRRTG